MKINFQKVLSEDIFQDYTIFTKEHKQTIANHLQIVDDDSLISVKLKKFCINLSFEAFLTETNVNNLVEDPENLFKFFKETKIWFPRLCFNNIDSFLEKALPQEKPRLELQDVSPQYFSFESVCSGQTNFIQKLNEFLKVEVSIKIAKKVFEYCQDQNAWPEFVCFTNFQLSSSPFEPTVTSTQVNENKSSENSFSKSRSMKRVRVETDREIIESNAKVSKIDTSFSSTVSNISFSSTESNTSSVSRIIEEFIKCEIRNEEWSDLKVFY